MNAYLRNKTLIIRLTLISLLVHPLFKIYIFCFACFCFVCLASALKPGGTGSSLYLLKQNQPPELVSFSVDKRRGNEKKEVRMKFQKLFIITKDCLISGLLPNFSECQRV